MLLDPKVSDLLGERVSRNAPSREELAEVVAEVRGTDDAEWTEISLGARAHMPVDLRWPYAHAKESGLESSTRTPR
jgi:hypothetical protein